MCKYDPEKADETVVRFSRYLRGNIEIMEDDKNIPFLQEMERLEDCVVLEQIRFSDRIEFITDIQANHLSIPPLILQSIVENAIKHSIRKRQEGSGSPCPPGTLGRTSSSPSSATAFSRKFCKKKHLWACGTFASGSTIL